MCQIAMLYLRQVAVANENMSTWLNKGEIKKCKKFKINIKPVDCRLWLFKYLFSLGSFYEGPVHGGIAIYTVLWITL
jgi:hypothetical protein